MSRLTIVALSIGLLLAAEVLSAQRVKQLGHAIVEFKSADVKAVAAYEYSRRFFSHPGRNVHDSFVTNLEETAAGDLFFKSTGGSWPSGAYRLVVSHQDARAELPIELD